MFRSPAVRTTVCSSQNRGGCLPVDGAPTVRQVRLRQRKPAEQMTIQWKYNHSLVFFLLFIFLINNRQLLFPRELKSGEWFSLSGLCCFPFSSVWNCRFNLMKLFPSNICKTWSLIFQVWATTTSAPPRWRWGAICPGWRCSRSAPMETAAWRSAETDSCSGGGTLSTDSCPPSQSPHRWDAHLPSWCFPPLPGWSPFRTQRNWSLLDDWHSQLVGTSVYLSHNSK